MTYRTVNILMALAFWFGLGTHIALIPITAKNPDAIPTGVLIVLSLVLVAIWTPPVGWFGSKWFLS